MKKTGSMRRIACTVGCLGALASAAASWAAQAALPVPLQTSGGISYYNGGAGLEERSQLVQLFPLKVMFATDLGNYLTDAKLSVAAVDGSRSWEFLADDGPWLIIDLPDGDYRLTATIGAVVKTASVTIKGKAKRTVLMRWKTTEVDMGL